MDPDATMVVLPADHVIRNVKAFHASLNVAISAAQENGALVTLGMQPDHPATGYGYIQFDPEAEGAEDSGVALPVRAFAEKPDVATAERFLDSGDFLWNSGMFVWRAETILDAIEQHLPDTYECFLPYRRALQTGPAEAELREAYQRCKGISIDYGVMERAEKVYVVPSEFDWSDVGDWKAVFDLSEHDSHGNAIHGQAILRGSSRCLIESEERLVVLVGIHDTMVIDTPDALLVCHRDNAQQVKQVVEYLYANQLAGFV
jgi:mannose-1-phosphate guanylyltransferase